MSHPGFSESLPRTESPLGSDGLGSDAVAGSPQSGGFVLPAMAEEEAGAPTSVSSLAIWGEAPSLSPAALEPDRYQRDALVLRVQRRFLALACGVAALLMALLEWAPDVVERAVAVGIGSAGPGAMAAPSALPTAEPSAPSARPAQAAPVLPAATPPEPAAARPQPPAAIPVELSVAPRSAGIWLDGKRVARGHLSAIVPAVDRSHEIRVEADGFVPAIVTFRGAPPPARLRLERLPEDEPSALAARKAKRRAARARRQAPLRARGHESRVSPPPDEASPQPPERRPVIRLIE